VIIGLLVIMAGCATAEPRGQTPDRRPPTAEIKFQAQCWQAALAAAIIMQSYGYKTEITIQDTGTPGVQHAQVRADHDKAVAI
jgi:hypothetical protein